MHLCQKKLTKTPCVHRHQSKKPLPKCSQCVPSKRFFRMLLLAMWPEAMLLRCPWGQRKVFEERSTVCVCVKMLKDMVPGLSPDPRAPYL